MSVPGVDVPDHRGRTGLDRVGRDLTGNPDVVVQDVELLAAAWTCSGERRWNAGAATASG